MTRGATDPSRRGCAVPARPPARWPAAALGSGVADVVGGHDVDPRPRRDEREASLRAESIGSPWSHSSTATCSRPMTSTRRASSRSAARGPRSVSARTTAPAREPVSTSQSTAPERPEGGTPVPSARAHAAGWRPTAVDRAAPSPSTASASDATRSASTTAPAPAASRWCAARSPSCATIAASGAGADRSARRNGLVAPRASSPSSSSVSWGAPFSPAARCDVATARARRP